MSRLSNYLQDTKTEMKHVSWPTRKQAIVYTVLVVGFSVLVAIILGLADFLFTRGLSFMINR